MLRHVVLFQFRDGTPDEIRSVKSRTPSGHCPPRSTVIQDFEWGTDVSVEGKAGGFTHCFFVTFGSEADRDAYLPHPDHAAFGVLLRPHLENVLVVDYWQRT